MTFCKLMHLADILGAFQTFFQRLLPRANGHGGAAIQERRAETAAQGRRSILWGRIPAIAKALLRSGMSYEGRLAGAAPISHLIGVLADADDIPRALGGARREQRWRG